MTQAEFIVDLNASRRLAFGMLKQYTQAKRDEHFVEELAGRIYMQAIEFNGMGEFRQFILQRARMVRNTMMRPEFTHTKVSAFGFAEDFDAAQTEHESIDWSAFSEDEAEMLKMKFIGGYSEESIGEKFGVTKQCINQRMQRVIEKAREVLA